MGIRITLGDGRIREYESGISLGEIASSISSKLGKNAVAGKLNGRIVDLQKGVSEDGEVEILTLESPEGLAILRHSTAHLMAQALKRIYGAKAVKLGIGPVIADGFYYDIDMEQKLSIDDLAAIEKEMKKIALENLPISRRAVNREDAISLFEEAEEPFKLELICDLPPDAEISIYEQGEFFDLCRGPHLPSTGRIKAFKLMNVAGAYWRGNSDNKMLQRIYGTAFPKESQLAEHLQMLEEAKKRDHRKLGSELRLFMFSEGDLGQRHLNEAVEAIKAEVAARS